MVNERTRGPFLTTRAVLCALHAISNCTKTLQYVNNPKVGGIVIFGVRFESVVSNAILGPLVGVVIGAYAYGLWKLKPWIAPLGFLLVYLAIAFTGLNRHRAAPRLSPREVGRRLIFALSICLIPHMGGSGVKGDAGYFNRLRSIT